MKYNKLRYEKLKLLESKFKGIWIPVEILAIDELTNLEKLVLAEIKALDSEATGCYAMNGHFALLFNKSKSRISKIIASLISKKLITSKLIYNKFNKSIKHRELRIL